MDPSSAGPPRSARKSFALTGRSVTLDPRTHAVRRDIADIRLAEYIFAPHYASPMERPIIAATQLRAERDPAAPVLTTLAPGDGFEVLEIAGPTAWGVAVAAGLVGYVDVAAIEGLGQ